MEHPLTIKTNRVAYVLAASSAIIFWALTVTVQTSLSCQISLDPIDQVTIPANGTLVSSQSNLASGSRYKIVVTGTYRYDVGEPGEFADAQYREDDNDQWTIRWNSVEFDGTRLDADVFDLSHHTYTFYVTGHGRKMTFRIYDDDYHDNEGSLIANIYLESTPTPTPSPTPGDPLFSQQWGIKKINIEDAWSHSQGASDVVIAVIDTGTEYTHVDLGSGKTLTDNDYDFVHDNDNAMDDNGHGTHVAGIAAANTKNNQGIAGVCPQCRILPLKVLDAAGEGDLNDVADAIIYATDQGARVINLSLGDGSCTSELANAINYAYERNVVIVAAAGNACPVRVSLGLESFDVDYPARFERVISVGATDNNDNRANFSCYGPELDVSAPGVGILSTYLSGSFRRLDGTSMASPMVAGTVGLLISQT